jgi:hypothetical protein
MVEKGGTRRARGRWMRRITSTATLRGHLLPCGWRRARRDEDMPEWKSFLSE